MIASLRDSWRRVDKRARVVIAIVAGIVFLNLLAFAIDLAYGRGPKGPASSSYATSPEGLAAYADLLERTGHPVTQLRSDPSTVVLDRDATLVLMAPGTLEESEPPALRSFVSGGGRLILGVDQESPWLEDLIDDPPTWSEIGVLQASPIAPVPETEGIDQVIASAVGSWEEEASTLPVLGDATNTIATVYSMGEGRIVFLADSSMLTNQTLSLADNAAFGLAMAGESDRPVLFAESFHGYRDASGWGAIPARWRWMIVGLALATATWMLSRARRLGPPDVKSRPLSPPRRAYVDALAATLGRTKNKEEAVAPVKAHARKLLAARAGMSPDASDQDLAHAAEALGLPPDEARALLYPAKDDASVIWAGRALARLSKGDR